MSAQNNVNSALACAASLSSKLDSISNQLNNRQNNDNQLQQILNKLSSIESQMSNLETRLSSVENKIGEFEGKFSDVQTAITAIKEVVLGTITKAIEKIDRVESIVNNIVNQVSEVINNAVNAIKELISQLLDLVRSIFGKDGGDDDLTYQDMVNLIERLSNKMSKIESSIIEVDNRNTNIILDALQPSIERLDNVEDIARDILELVKSLKNAPIQQCKEPNLLPILGAISGVALSIGGLALALKGIEAAIRAIKINLRGELEVSLKPILNATLELNNKIEALKRCCDKGDASPDLLKIVGDISSRINKSTTQIIQNDNKNASEITNNINNSTSKITNNDNRNTNQVTNTVNNSTSQVTNTVNNSTSQVTNTVNSSANQTTNNTSNNITQTIQEIIEIEYSTITVPVFERCEDKQPIFKTEQIAVQKGLEATESLKFQRIAEIEGKQCGLETVALVPEWWQIRIEGGVPQFVVAFGEVDKDSGKCGHSKYAMTIPHFINQKPHFCPIPRYRKGDYELIAIFKDNSKLIINAFSEYECERVYFAILPWINSDYASSAKYKVGKRVSQPFKQIWVCPRFGKYFSTGNRDTNPDWTVYF